jgi:5'-methylthioadenosine phosphorylase
MESVDIGIIGGTGFYQMEFIDNPHYIELETPFGRPSEKILLGEIAGKSVAFLCRHGLHHLVNPTKVNYRANIYAMKMLNVKRLVSGSAVGSLKEEIKPTDLVIPDQFFDYTFKREKTFFNEGLAVHVSMAKPTCSYLSSHAFDIAEEIGIRVHKGGTYLNIEGPQFSSQGESNIYRKLGLSIIGMTQAVESKLAREMELCYLPLSFVTDYDCWHEEAEAVSADMVNQTLQKNAKSAQRLIQNLVKTIEEDNFTCNCSKSLEGSIITDLNLVPQDIYSKLKIVLEKYKGKS